MAKKWPNVSQKYPKLSKIVQSCPKRSKKYAYVIYEWPLSGYVIPAHAQALKITIKNHIDILLQDFNDDTDLLKILPNVGLQVVQDINDYLKANKKDLLPDSTKATLQVNLFKNPLFQKI